MATAFASHPETRIHPGNARRTSRRLERLDIGRPVSWIIDQVVTAKPFSGRLSVMAMADTLGSGSYDAIIAIPARNEEGLIAKALSHAAASAAHDSSRCAVLIIVNNSTDATFAIARDFLAENDLPALVLDTQFDTDIADIGHIRRFALDLASRLPSAQYLLSTDADGRVGKHWVSRAIAALDVSELVCGNVETDRVDLARLPDIVRICGKVETDLRNALNDLWLVVNGPSSRGFTNRGSGANMAVRADSYRLSGGLPLVPCGEDRALHTLFETQRRAIRHDEAMLVTVSGRTDSRVGGGMAACLASRAEDGDPFVDDQLLPARLLLKRALEHRDNAVSFPKPAAARLRVSQAREEIRKARLLIKKLRSGRTPFELLAQEAPLQESNG